MPSSSISSRLQSKIAIVTGGSSGFGSAIALRFAYEGAHVIITDINEVAGLSVCEEFTSKSGVAEAIEGGNGSQIWKRQRGSMEFVKADVASEEDWKGLMGKVLERWGRVDVLVNNAGTTYRNKSSLEVTEAEFDRVFAVNLKSIFFSTAAFVPQAIERKEGAVMINIASIGATRPRPGLVWYNASKGAVCNATKGLAAEFGPYQIRVNAICPLLTGTGLFESFVGVKDTPENRKQFLGNVPLGRLGETSDIANACLFLASDEAKFVTGICMDVDGGRGV